MKLESIDQKSFVTIQVCERNSDRFPSLRCRIEAQAGDFIGRNDSLWIEQDALERFVGELQRVERTRRGKSGLESMSPGDLLLEIKTVDSAGHLVVALKLGRVGQVGSEVQRFSMEGSFEIDPGSIPSAVLEVRALTRWERQT